MNRIKTAIRDNSLYYKLIAIVVLAITITAVIVLIATAGIMQTRFIKIYTDETRLLMEQIRGNYEDLHKDVVEVMSICPGSQACTAYLTGEEISAQEQSSLIYTTNRIFKETSLLNDKTPSTLLIVSKDGRTFLNNRVTRNYSAREIWESDLVQSAMQSPRRTTYHYVQQPFLSNLMETGSFAAVRFLRDDSQEIYAVEILFIDLHDFQEYYDSIIDKQVILVEVLTNDGRVISSNNSQEIGTMRSDLLERIHTSGKTSQFIDETYGAETMMVEDMGFFSCYLTAILHNNSFYRYSAQWSILFGTTLLILAVTCLLVYLIVRRSMRPVQQLIDKMSDIREEGFDSPIEVKGDGELRRLAISYNYMLDDMNAYVEELMDAQEQKQLAQINALQMQINPHFMYNTLTSFKFLVWQKKDQQLLEALDAFIALLRGTLNAQGTTTVAKEIENLKNYSAILQIRYGDHIQVHYQIDPEAMEDLIPTMIVQPFVENAFFHAFSETDKGMIQIFVREREKHLIIEVMDNGKGMAQDAPVKDSFTGIGIHNVDDRIKLLYGSQYGVQISSMPERGTIITLRLPILKKAEDPSLPAHNDSTSPSLPRR